MVTAAMQRCLFKQPRFRGGRRERPIPFATCARLFVRAAQTHCSGLEYVMSTHACSCGPIHAGSSCDSAHLYSGSSAIPADSFVFKVIHICCACDFSCSVCRE